MKSQKGITLTGMIVFGILTMMLMLLAFKIIPVYVEYYAIQKQFKALSLDPKIRNVTRNQLATIWAARAAVDDLRSMDSDFIEITKEGEEVIVSGEYSVKVPLFKSVSACFDFKPSSK